MSACAPFRERMLEADPPELRGEGDGPLARHLRTCPACARAAAVLLAETARLDALLGERADVDVPALLARAGVGPGAVPTSSPRAAAAAPGTVAAPPARGRRFPSRRFWIPLAAAAALAALLLVYGPGTRTPPASMAAAQPAPTLPVVEPAAGQDAAIIRTDDPEITVVWLFKTG